MITNLRTSEKKIVCSSLEDIGQAAIEFLNYCKGERVFALYGEMGAGKTTFIKAICEQLGVEDIVTSPTFAIVNEYQTKDKKTIYHFDFYRIKNETEAFDLGYEEYFYSENSCFIEWPEKISNLLPENLVKVFINVEYEKRVITIQK